MNRVVVTGMGCISALGENWSQVGSRLRERRNAIRYMSEWDQYEGLFTRLGGPVTDFDSAFKANTKRFAEYFSGMQRGGVYLAPSQFEAAFISLAHSKADLDRTLAVQRRVLKKLAVK